MPTLGFTLTRRSADVINWGEGDPRVDQLASDMAEHYLAHPDQLEIITALQIRSDTEARYGWVARHREKHDSANAPPASPLETKLRAGGATLPGATPLQAIR